MISGSKRGSTSKIAIRGWAEFIRVEQALLDRVEEDLKAASFPPLVWYDVLLELVKEPSGRLRHRDLHRRMLLTKYNLSRLLDRLEAEGLVSREPIEEDARGEYLCLTSKGRELQRSEEHTSELQSRSDLVCRLLLEKKKKHKHEPQTLVPASGNLHTK